MPLGQKANHFSRWPLPLTDNFLASFSLGYGQGNQSWVFTGRIDVEAETPILRPPDAKSWLIWKDPDAGKDWGEGDDRGWDGWMASPTRSTWVWVDSVSWWWTGRPDVLRSMGSQRVGHDWATEMKFKIDTLFMCGSICNSGPRRHSKCQMNDEWLMNRWGLTNQWQYWKKESLTNLSF